MTTLTLFEHGIQAYDWQDADLMALAELIQRTKTTPITLTADNRQRVIKANHYVGVVHLGQQVIHILPKLDRDDDLAKVTNNLLYLLSVAYDLNIPAKQPADLAAMDESPWYEVLIRFFADQLRRQWLRGAVRDYQPVHEVLPMVRGRIDIPVQLRQPAHKHRLAVNYDEYLLDTTLNRILRYVVEQLYRTTRNPLNRKRLHELRDWMAEVKLLTHLTIKDIPANIITRLNAHFSPVLALAKLFLQSQSLTFKTGGYSAYAFVFDMNVLFEQFVSVWLARHNAYLPAPLRTSKLVVQGQKDIRYLLQTPDGAHKMRLKPDLAYRAENGKYHLLIDAKYKQINNLNDVSSADVYQMLAYLTRYNCERVILLYPQSGVARLHEQLTFIDRHEHITIATLSLQHPLTTSLGQQVLRDEMIEILRKEFDYERD